MICWSWPLKYTAFFLCFIGYLKRNLISLRPSRLAMRYFGDRRIRQSSLFVWTLSLYFYFKRLWRYSALSPHCSFLAVKVFGVQAQLVSLITQSTSKLFISNFVIAVFLQVQAVYWVLLFYTQVPLSYSVSSPSPNSKALRGWLLVLLVLLLSPHLQHLLFNLQGNQVILAAVSHCCPTFV